ncbi:hypothetical protein [Streptomyces sp. 8N706]|uniref:hypothetical protein n=1 Tax=Streptomyces sp. 8N706 TaxID=3457416 RepID=UPI003FD04A1A
MAVLAVLIPFAMLGVVLALGRYEELMLTPSAPRSNPARRLVRGHPDRSHKGGGEE